MADRAGIEQELKEAVGFGLKIQLFQSVENQVQLIENLKNLKFFFAKKQLKTNFHDMKCIKMIPEVFKNIFHSSF